MIKESIKTLEGKGFVGIIATLVPVIWTVVVNFGFISTEQKQSIENLAELLPIEKLVTDSKSAEEIAKIYQTYAGIKVSNVKAEGETSKDVASVLMVVALLTFLRFVYKDFTNARTSLKLKEMEVAKVLNSE